ncbi:hypothetical protein DET61_11928 [Marinobacter nauticus]|uniref:Uncharacterized protein n=1 Tax=Marinobacter nauticus TaxID=2743 RepID=A0A368X5G9_MARNT|nr:hypothetical protein DET61_11928 [Marinobacter nauticus]
MIMKIEEKLLFDDGYTVFKFNVVSETDGLRVWLTSWEHKVDGMKLKRWAHMGNDGSFCKRDQIEIPDEVKKRVRQKVIDGIFFD